MSTSDVVSTQKVKVAPWSEIDEHKPAYALVANVDLVVIRYGAQVSVLYGRCLHRGALLADGRIEGDNLICGVHNWDYRYDTGVSSYNNEEALHKFSAWVDTDDDAVYVDEYEVRAWEQDNPQPYDRDAYQGLYADVHGGPEEPHTLYIQELAKNGLKNFGHHGKVSAMGVPLTTLPRWDDIQILTGQLARKPLLDDADVGTDLVIGPNAKKPLTLKIPLFVSDMSFGALSAEAKTALSKGAELSGTGICSGEGGMLPAEQENNSRYFYELASARFGWSLDRVARCQAFHFKGGQGAKTGTGGIFRAPRSVPKSQPCEDSNLASRRSVLRPSPISSRQRITERLLRRSARSPVEFRSASNYLRSTSKLTLTSRWRSEPTTSSSMDEAVRRVRRPRSSRTISPFPRWRPSRGRGGIWTCAAEAM